MAQVIGENTKEICLAHLSQEANTKEMALDTYQRVFDEEHIYFDNIKIADQKERLFLEDIMKIRILTIGKLKEKYLVNGINEYVKRLNAYCKVEMVEVPDEPIPDNASENVENIIKDKEADKIVSKIKDDEYVIVLDLHGKEIDSVAFSKHIEECMIRGKSTITFVIGGSLGLGKSLLQRANYRLCFSKMTFPHQLMKLILVEQVYRAYKIMRRETYHK